MKYGYSFSKTFGKGIVWVLQLAAAAAVVAGLSEISLWDLATKYIQPILGTLTVGGAIAMITNYVKYNWLSE